MRSELGYDGAGRVHTITSKRSGVVEETLTRTFSNGRLVSSLDSAYSGSESYAYDAAGRVSTITYPGGERREFGYDLRSRVTSERFVDAAEATVLELTYAYDLANRVVEIRRQPLNVLQLKYTYTNGFVTQTDYGNGLRRTVTMNPSFGLPYTSVTRNAQSQIVEDSLQDYGNGLIVSTESTIAGSFGKQVFATWNEWRLYQTIQNWNDAPSESEYFDWDSLSNYRTGGSQTYNAEANRLTAVNSASRPHTYSYDAAGFTTDRDGVALTYDATGAIASIGTLATLDHDLDGRPVSRTLNGVTKNFRFGGAIAYSTAGIPIEADLGEVVIKLDGTGNRYRHLDFRGNVLFQTNASGNVTGQALYRAFGRSTASGNVGERGFAGGFEIPSLGLVVLGPRVLDSDVGRFLSPDPVYNAVNQYAYAQGNPVFFWDPDGSQMSEAQAQTVYGAAGWAGAIGGAVIGGRVGGQPGAIVGAYFGRLYGILLAWKVAELISPGQPRPQSPEVLNPWSVPVEPVGGTGGTAGGAVGLPPYPEHPLTDSPNCYLSGTCDQFAGGSSALAVDFSGINGLGSLTFSIALSFGGAMW
jgi:RHS repeat-associated protein